MFKALLGIVLLATAKHVKTLNFLCINIYNYGEVRT